MNNCLQSNQAITCILKTEKYFFFFLLTNSLLVGTDGRKKSVFMLSISVQICADTPITPFTYKELPGMMAAITDVSAWTPSRTTTDAMLGTGVNLLVCLLESEDINMVMSSM